MCPSPDNKYGTPHEERDTIFLSNPLSINNKTVTRTVL